MTQDYRHDSKNTEKTKSCFPQEEITLFDACLKLEEKQKEWSKEFKNI